jgi:hypothetical protein
MAAKKEPAGKAAKPGAAPRARKVAKAQPNPAAAKKSTEELRTAAEIGEGVFRQLFGASADLGDVVQISFSDLESGTQQKENMLTVRPREYVKTADRISNHIVEGFEKGEAEFRAGYKTAGGIQPTVTRVSFSSQFLDMGESFSSLDKEVLDAVVSLYAAGNKVFSPAMVYRTMAGKSDSSFVPQEKIAEVSDSIYKCMSSVITIDASEEASEYGLEAKYSQNLLYAKSVTLKTKGWEVSAFLLLDEPVLYKYAKQKRQLFSVPLQVLDSPPNKTNDIIVLQGYLVRVVESLRRSGESGSEILYETIYELLGCSGGTKQKLQRVRNNVKAVLDYWVEIGYISGFEETMRERSKYSVVVEVGGNQLV